MRVKVAIEIHPLFAEAMLEWAQEEYEHWPGDAYRAELAELIGQLTAGVSAVAQREQTVRTSGTSDENIPKPWPVEILDYPE
jgi:hypothetical protein